MRFYNRLLAINLCRLALGGQTVKNLRLLASKFELDQIQRKSTQVVASRCKSTQVRGQTKRRLNVDLRVGLARALYQNFSTSLTKLWNPKSGNQNLTRIIEFFYSFFRVHYSGLVKQLRKYAFAKIALLFEGLGASPALSMYLNSAKIIYAIVTTTLYIQTRRIVAILFSA